MKRVIAVTLQALRAALARRLYGRHVVALIHDSKHGLFALGAEDAAMARRLRRDGQWGERELAGLAPYVTGDCAVLVVGAHVGTLAIPLARSCHRVVALEPNPDSYRLLCANLALNGISNCRTVNLAAGDENAPIDFLVSRANSGGSKRVPLLRRYVYYFDRPRTIRVDAVRLDDHLRDESFDVVVMDIEGSEYFALKGMQRILGSARALQVEFEPHHLKNVSGVSVEEFVSVIEPHFSRLTVPSKGLSVGRDRFVAILSEMYWANERDDGVIFNNA